MDNLIRSLAKGSVNSALPIRSYLTEFLNKQDVKNYLRSDRRPWRRGYRLYRNKYLADALRDVSILNVFRSSEPLPLGYGFRLDARVVEIPWVLTHLQQRSHSILDAGSSLNFDFVLTAPLMGKKKLTIITLALESQYHWRLGVPYVFDDLRRLCFKDDYFDDVVYISTIEHVGMGNSMYAGSCEAAQRGEPHQFILAIKELKRVLKPGGALYCTSPFGEYEDHGWFQQFDSALADILIEAFDPKEHRETIFRYDPDGWKMGDRASCMHCQFFDVHKSKYFDHSSKIEYPPDYPAGERAVMCLELFK